MGVFSNKRPNTDKLVAYGFKKNSEKYEYDCKIMDGEFNLHIEVSQDNVKTEVTEIATKEPYTLHLVESADGKFVGKVREEYERVLKSVADNCFETDIYKSEYTKKVIKYILEKYGDKAEYLWEKFPKYAIFRNRKTEKWYVLIGEVKKIKLGIDSNEDIEIINLHAKPEVVEELVKAPDIYPAYHMNKKHWITIILDGSVELKKIYKLIDESYCLSHK